MRWFRNFLVAVALWVLIGIFAFLLVTRQGFAVRGSPGRLETSIALRLRDRAVPREEKKLQNPLARDPEAWQDGRDHFAEHCALCHDPDGRGRGYVPRHLDPPSPDLSQPRTQRLSDGTLFAIIQNGVRWTGMPAWKDEHTPEETWKLVSYIRHLATLRLNPYASMLNQAAAIRHTSTRMLREIILDICHRQRLLGGYAVSRRCPRRPGLAERPWPVRRHPQPERPASLPPAARVRERGRPPHTSSGSPRL